MKENHLHIYLCICCFLCSVLLPRDPHSHLLLLSFSWRAGCGIPVAFICQQWILSFLLISAPSLENIVCEQDPGGLCPSFSTTAPGCQGPTISKAMVSFSAAFKLLPSPLVFYVDFRWCHSSFLLFMLFGVHQSSCICTHVSPTTLGNFSVILYPLLGLWSWSFIPVTSILLSSLFSKFLISYILFFQFWNFHLALF